MRFLTGRIVFQYPSDRGLRCNLLADFAARPGEATAVIPNQVGFVLGELLFVGSHLRFDLHSIGKDWRGSCDGFLGLHFPLGRNE